MERLLRRLHATCLVAAGVLVIGLVVGHSIRVARVHQNSMAPTVRDGQLLFCIRAGVLAVFSRHPSAGDVALIQAGNAMLIKRIDHLGISSITGEATAYVLGDNPIQSTDSRSFGAVPIQNIEAICGTN